MQGDHGRWTCGFGDSSREEKGERSAERCAFREGEDDATAQNMYQTLTPFLLPRAALQDYELCLRSSCKKIRVVTNISGDADLLVTGSPSVAVKVFDSLDIEQFEKTASITVALEQASREGIGSLACFRDSFENTLVVFVLRGEQQRDQLSRRDSFFSAAQRSLQLPPPGDREGKGKRRVSRTVIVTSASGAVDAIRSVVASLDKSRCEKRELYFRNTAGSHLHPSSRPSQGGIADHVVREFNKWSERNEMLEDGEANVLLHMIGSLEKLFSAKSLDNVPIRNQGKRICEFFGNPVDGIENTLSVDRDRSEREFDPSSSTPYPQPQAYFQTGRKLPFVGPDPALTGGTQQFTPMMPSKLSFNSQQQSIFPAEYGTTHDFRHSSRVYEHANGSGIYDQPSGFAEASARPQNHSKYAGHVRAECPPTNPPYMYDYHDQRYDGDI